jgi:aryl carrier-like protein
VSKWIDTQRITLIHCVPTLFRVIRAELPSGDVFASLRLILLSGERIIPSELKDWYDRFGSRIRLVNFYGPTETTMIRFYYPLQRSDVSLQRIPVGQPIADTSFLIAQNGFTPCQLLVPGELYILSDYGTKGYLNAPDLTAEKFLTIEDGDRGPRPAFRTGDTAKLLSDGKVDLLGRKDRQVKIRGVRIEPDEIENVLIESGLVENAVAVRQDGDNGNDRLIVFFVEKEGLAGDASSRVQACLEERLPSYMVPSAFIPVAAFPLLSNGKIDYRTLSTMEPAGNLVAPANDIEERLLYLWKEILGNKPISTDDNFASLGGNSLSIMRLIARIYKDIHVRITLADIFSNLTIQKQAVLIGKAGRDNLYVIPRAGSKPSYPLSLAQGRMYFNYELNPRSTAYNMPLAWEITGSADAAGPRIPDGITSDRLKAAFIALIDRHVSLRTAFRFIDGSLRQVITDGFDVILEEKEVDSISPDEAVAGFVRPFDLGEAPLIRAGLLTLSTGRRILAVDVHHICCDGISQMILLEDFLRSYEGAQLKPLAIQYSDYAEWESDFRKTEEYRTHREFWLQRFEGELPRIEWPGEGPGGEPGGGVGSVNEGANIRWTPDPAIVDTITHRWAEWDITTFSGLFAVYLLFLSRYTGQDDLVIGINTSGRLQEELEGVTGMFAKTLPIRYRIDPSLSVKTFVQQVHRHLAEAVSRQIYDLADIVGDLNASRKTPVQDLFDTVFVFQNFGVGGGSQIFSKLTLKKRTAKYPLTFFVTESAGGIHFEAEYARHRWTAESIQHMADQYGKFLSLFSENMDGVVGDCLGGDTIAEAVTEESIVFKF